MTSRILVVGDIVTDIVAVVEGPISRDSDTAATIAITGGGAGANTASWLATSGVDVTLCGVVGDDPAGGSRVEEVAAAGVRCAIRRAPEAATGTIVVVAGRAERSMLTDRGANLLLAPSDIDAALDDLEPPVHLHLSGYPLLDASSRPAAEHALAAARSRGMTTSVDAASAAMLRRAPGFIEWVRGVDVLFANADEARALITLSTAAAEPLAAESLAVESLAVELARVVGVAVVKLGGDGAVASSHGSLYRVEAAPCEVVDATGAGDAFAAGFLPSWLAGGDIGAALVAGAALGARAVTIVGARPAA